MRRNFRRRLFTMVCMAFLLTPCLVWHGHAGIEPGDTEVLSDPQLTGEFIAMFFEDPFLFEERAAFAFVGKCKGNKEKPFVLGPVIETPFPRDLYDEIIDSSLSGEGVTLPSDLVTIPPGCFSDSDVIVGFFIDQVKKVKVQTTDLFIAEVIGFGVRVIPE